jgi:hypothetical protein
MLLRTIRRIGWLLMLVAFALFPSLAVAQGELKPNIDVTQYGGRAINVALSNQTTATIRSGSNTAVLASASIFQNGDGVVVYGAGATQTLLTPTAPTIMPGLIKSPSVLSPVATLPAASSTYKYAIVAADQHGGLAPVSSTTTITNGPAKLGGVQITVTSMSRSKDVITVQTTTNHGLVQDALVHLSQCSDASFSGYYNVSTIVDNTHFKVADTGMDTRSGASSSCTGGTVAYFVANSITWTAVTNAWEYYICAQRPGDGSYHRIGVSMPSGSTYPVTTFLDFGSPLTANANLPDYAGDSICTAETATNDYLSTTITGGGGTTTLTLANSASNTVSGSTIKFDDAPTILAAAKVALSYGASLYIPNSPIANGSFVINSYLALPNGLHISQSGPLTLNQTVRVGGVAWSGASAGGRSAADSFTWTPQITVATANPGIYGYNSNYSLFSNILLSGIGNTNQNILMLFDDSHNVSWDYDGLVTSSGNNDDTGMAVILRSAGNGFGFYFKKTNFSGGPDQVVDQSWFPELYMPGALGGNGLTGNWSMQDCFFHGRGITQDAYGGPGFSVDVNNIYDQGMITPFLAVANGTGGEGGFIHLKNIHMDTSVSPLLAVLSTGGSNSASVKIEDYLAGGQEVGGPPNAVTGQRVVDLKADNILSPLGQDRNAFVGAVGTLDIPTYGYGNHQLYSIFDTVDVAPPYTISWPLPAPTGVSVEVATGGSLTQPLNYKIGVTAVGFDGGESALSVTSSATTSSENRTINITWRGVPGAASYNVYDETHGTAANGCTGVTTLSCSYTSVTCCTHHGPTAAGTGTTVIGPTSVITPSLILTGPLNTNVSYKGTVKASPTANRIYSFPDGNATLAIPASFTTTSGASDNVTIQGVTSNSHCELQPTNASAAANLSTTYVSAKATNQITVTHTKTSGMTFDILCTSN